MIYIYGTIDERLKNYIDKSGDCWLWTSHTNEKGYGLLSVGRGKQVRVHRYMYELYKGQIPDGLHVLHKCDVRRCCNPDHLFLGTQKDNMEDASKKGRIGYKSFNGESHHNSKLKKEDVIEMRKLWESGSFFQSELAKRFNVTQQVVSKVVNFKAWKKLDGTTLVTLKNK